VDHLTVARKRVTDAYLMVLSRRHSVEHSTVFAFAGPGHGPADPEAPGSRNVRAAPPTNGGRRPPVDATFRLPGGTADVAT